MPMWSAIATLEIIKTQRANSSIRFIAILFRSAIQRFHTSPCRRLNSNIVPGAMAEHADISFSAGCGFFDERAVGVDNVAEVVSGDHLDHTRGVDRVHGSDNDTACHARAVSERYVALH